MCSQTNKMLLKVYPFLRENKILKYINDCEEEIIIVKSFYEIFSFFLLIVGFFTGTNGFLIILAYIQFIKFKYYSSEITSKIFRFINDKLNNLKNSSNMPSFGKEIINGIQNIGDFLLNCTNNFQAQNMQIAFCNIF